MSRCFLNYVEMHNTLRFAVYFWSKSPDPGSWIVFLSVWMTFWQLDLISGARFPISLNGLLTATSFIRGNAENDSYTVHFMSYIFCCCSDTPRTFLFFVNKGNQKSGSNYEKERRRILSHSVFFFSFCYRFLFLN